MLKLWSGLLVGALVFCAALLGSTPSSAGAPLAARDSDEAGVQVVVTPTAVGPGLAIWEFEVSMQTHTKPLNEDLSQLAVLVDDAGRPYAPIAWQGDPPGGHHRTGVLSFTAPAEIPAFVELRIDRIGGAGVRTFRWELK